MRGLRLPVMMPVIMLLLSGSAFAKPDVWNGGFGQGRAEYSIGNRKANLLISCNVETGMTSEHVLSLEVNGNELFSGPDHVVAFLVDGKRFEFSTADNGRVISSSRDAADLWGNFITALQKAKTIELYYDDSRITKITPKRSSLKNIEFMSDSCKPLFYREK